MISCLGFGLSILALPAHTEVDRVPFPQEPARARFDFYVRGLIQLYTAGLRRKRKMQVAEVVKEKWELITFSGIGTMNVLQTKVACCSCKQVVTW